MTAAEPSGPTARPADRVPVPGYVPRELLGPLVPWSQRYVFWLAATSGASLDDLWDEALTALLRATVVELRSHDMVVSLYASSLSGADADRAAAGTGRGDGGTSDADHDH